MVIPRLTPEEAIEIKSYLAMCQESNVGCKYSMYLSNRGTVTIAKSRKYPDTMYLQYWEPNTYDEDDPANWSRQGTLDALETLIDELTLTIYDVQW